MDERTYIQGIPTYTPVQSTEWSRPGRAWIDEDENGEWVYFGGPGGGPVKAGAAQDILLVQFMDLRDGPPERIAHFVRKWGYLDLCRHGLPSSHLPRERWEDLTLIGAQPCTPAWHFPRNTPRELVSDWRRFASQASSIHTAAGFVLTGQRVPDEIWQQLSGLYPPGWILGDQQAHLEQEGIGGFRAEPREKTEHRLLQHAVQRWLQMGNVNLSVTWDGPDGHLRYGGIGLVGALAMQLALTCTSTGAFFICSHCGNPYIPEKRRPSKGQTSYCRLCRDDGVPGRIRQQRYREKKRLLSSSTPG